MKSSLVQLIGIFLKSVMITVKIAHQNSFLHAATDSDDRTAGNPGTTTHSDRQK